MNSGGHNRDGISGLVMVRLGSKGQEFVRCRATIKCRVDVRDAKNVHKEGIDRRGVVPQTVDGIHDTGHAGPVSRRQRRQTARILRGSRFCLSKDRGDGRCNIVAIVFESRPGERIRQGFRQILGVRRPGGGKLKGEQGRPDVSSARHDQLVQEGSSTDHRIFFFVQNGLEAGNQPRRGRRFDVEVSGVRQQRTKSRGVLVVADADDRTSQIRVLLLFAALGRYFRLYNIYQRLYGTTGIRSVDFI
mmetsp:Transcript_42519/g.88566  ORF Transcript_42519/g.88566 Transcript_42519/m.88566 type:complete len:246 (+) Transcript_42519:1428-2165(+)